MSTSKKPHQEQTSNYFISDHSSQEEQARLQSQDRMITASMGGVLPEQPDPANFRHVLDVGCGSGGWLIEVAKTYPRISFLMGVDISNKMIEYARAEALAQGVSNRVEFHVMDALGILEFPYDYFDLVNHRLGIGYLRTKDWPTLLHQYLRSVRPGGIIRITEAEPFVVTTAVALTSLCSLLIQALYRAGHLFTLESNGLTSQLASLMSENGIANIQKQNHPLEYRAGTVAGQQFYENERDFFRTIVPFLRKWTSIPDNYEELYQQALDEMQQPDFVGTWNLLTAWGIKPLD